MGFDGMEWDMTRGQDGIV